MSKTLLRSIKRLIRGVYVRGLLMQLRCCDASGERWQVIVFEAVSHEKAVRFEFEGRYWQVRELFEGDLHLVRKIACAYYPSAARFFGSSRQYVAFRPLNTSAKDL